MHYGVFALRVRIVNAVAGTYADIQIDGQPLEIIALDGMPRGYYL